MSMFITVRAPSRTKMKKSAARMEFTSRCNSPAMSPTKSKERTPKSSNVYMLPGTLGKRSFPTCVPCVIWRKAMPKTYMRMTSRQSVVSTERMDATIPFTRIRSSGIARRSRAIRAMRESRIRRAILKIWAFPKAPPFPLLKTMTTKLMTHVSSTIMLTRTESKRNQASFSPSRFLLKAKNLTSHSPRKKMQNKFSMICMATGASARVVAVLLSVSIQIQSAFKAMTQSVMFSKAVLLAILCQTPVSL
mmetsp:Transcript_56886/g.123068  ORF Transcript_56886/g.123068 Transcript_56886/m.123068 type:complete len:248 (+) Transcript_56886:708-1451(+)